MMVIPMEIYLLRHGIAEDRSKLRRVLERAHQAGVRPSLILTSPLRRALETAEIAAHELGYEGKLVRTDALVPGGTPRDLWQELRQHRDESSILLAGHDPLFTSSVAYLLGSTHHMVHFRKGAL